MTFTWIPCLLLLSAAGMADDSILPPDGFLGVWNKAESNPKVFRGSDLYGHIDGGAELFLEFGFEQLTVQDYVHGSDTFSVELYRMTDAEAAAGVFLMKAGTHAKAQLLPVPCVLGPYQLVLASDRYLLVLNNLEGTEERQAAMLEFARHVISKSTASGGRVGPTRFLPIEGLRPGSFRLIRGPYALQSIFTLGPGNILSLAPGQTIAAGDYTEGSHAYTLIAAVYPSEKEAAKAFRHLSGRLDPYLRVLERRENRLVFQDYADEFGVASLAGPRLEVRVHLKARPGSAP